MTHKEIQDKINAAVAECRTGENTREAVEMRMITFDKILSDCAKLGFDKDSKENWQYIQQHTRIDVYHMLVGWSIGEEVKDLEELPTKEDLHQEPTITINGKTLTTAESMTFRVALGSFMIDMDTNNEPLGNDVHGKAMQSAYLYHSTDIMKKLIEGL